MSSFEWMELQTLTSEITSARSRLAMARTKRDQSLARALEEEITAAETRRDRLLSHITSDLAGAAGHPPPAAAEEADPAEEADAVDEPALEPEPPVEEPFELVAEPIEQQPVEPVVVSAPEPPARAVAENSIAGGALPWNRLAPGDIERAKEALRARRGEMLSRHTEELRGLDAERGELDALAASIDAFVSKFNLRQAGAAIVHLDEEREMRQQGRA